MASRAEKSVRFMAAGVVAIAAALVFGLRSYSGGPDWVGIITCIAGVAMIVAGLLAAFRGGGASHTA